MRSQPAVIVIRIDVIELQPPVLGDSTQTAVAMAAQAVLRVGGAKLVNGCEQK
jgi:hypothetical protein